MKESQSETTSSAEEEMNKLREERDKYLNGLKETEKEKQKLLEELNDLLKGSQKSSQDKILLSDLQSKLLAAQGFLLFFESL